MRPPKMRTQGSGVSRALPQDLPSPGRQQMGQQVGRTHDLHYATGGVLTYYYYYYY
jgi:hypothetical protein